MGQNKLTSRRRFLKSSAALGLTAGVAPAFGQILHPNVIAVTETRARGLLSKYEDTERIRFRRNRNPNATALTPLQDLNGIITPSELHFVVDHENGVLLDINPARSDVGRNKDTKLTTPKICKCIIPLLFFHSTMNSTHWEIIFHHSIV